MKALNEGQIPQVTTDKPDLVEMVRNWAGESGHTIEEEHVTSGVTTIILRKGRVAPVRSEVIGWRLEACVADRRRPSR